MRRVIGDPAAVHEHAQVLHTGVVDVDVAAYGDALAAFLGDPDNDFGDDGLIDLTGDLEAALGEVERVAVAGGRFADALLLADRDAATGMATTHLTAAAWQRLQTGLDGLDNAGLYDRAVSDQHHLDQAAATDALDRVRDGLDGGWGEMRQGDFEQVRQVLEGLEPRVLDLVVAGLDDEELRDMFDQMHQPRWRGGLSHDERGTFHLTVGRLASPDTWRRFASFTDEIDPPVLDPVANRARMLADDDPDGDPDGGSWHTLHDPAVVGGFQARDVQQGLLADCYLLAAMQNIAIRAPEALDRVVQPTGNGLYVVTYDDGHQQVVSADLPFKPPGELAFAHPDDDDPTPELWGMLIEKAHAQRNGGWEAIQNGRTEDAVEDLTGRRAEQVRSDDIDLDDLADRFEAGQMLTIATNDPPPPSEPLSGPAYDAYQDEWARTQAPDIFRTEVDGVARGKWERMIPNHAAVVTGVDRAARTITVINPGNPVGSTLVLSEDDLHASADYIGVNHAS